MKIWIENARNTKWTAGETRWSREKWDDCFLIKFCKFSCRCCWWRRRGPKTTKKNNSETLLVIFASRVIALLRSSTAFSTHSKSQKLHTCCCSQAACAFSSSHSSIDFLAAAIFPLFVTFGVTLDNSHSYFMFNSFLSVYLFLLSVGTTTSAHRFGSFILSLSKWTKQRTWTTHRHIFIYKYLYKQPLQSHLSFVSWRTRAFIAMNFHFRPFVIFDHFFSFVIWIYIFNFCLIPCHVIFNFNIIFCWTNAINYSMLIQ